MNRITAADYHDIVQVEEPRVAPDGDRVAYVRKVPEDDDSYEATIYVVPTGGGEPRRFTIEEGVDSEPRFSPSGDRLAFVSTRGEDDDRPQLWVLPTDGGEARQVTAVSGGVGSIAWRPDGSAITFVQQASAEDREEERDLEAPDDWEADPADPRVIDRTVYRSTQQYFDGKRSHVYLADLERDDVNRLTEGDRDFAAPEWGDANTLYYTESVGDDPDDSMEYNIIEHDVKRGTSAAVHTAAGWATHLAATADGRVAHPHTDPDRATLNQTDLHVVDVDAEHVTTPTADLDRTLGLDAAPQWGPDEEQLYFTAPDEGAVTLWAVGWEDTEPERVLREDGASIDGVDVGADVVALVKSEWDHPGDVFAMTLGGAEQHRLTRVNAEYLDERGVSQPDPVRYEGPDGQELEGWLLTPPDFDPSEQYPLVVEVHGGPHAMWTTSGTMFHEFQTLAARGYVVFWSNPRGSAGYGEAFMSAIDRDWGTTTMDDVLAGVDHVTDREYVDGSQVFLTGGSFGGFMTGWMVGNTDRFEAAVAQRGVYDLTGFYGSTDGAYKLVEGDFGTTPSEEPEFLWQQSPVAHADAVETPTLVVHSDDDYRTPASTAELFYRLLRKHGVDTRFVRYPDEGHELSRSGQPAHVVDRIERIARWFDGYSESHDAPPALERDDEAELSAGEGADDTEK
ncbi:S9 family peptidase [Natranaeroarchaeum aerophilus]|uniref:S9 family peptidase n=1 Tax=Natranaeroarchaeum aerophilus TaxID=2917711 RepID=A0AAE3K651_9EURY|nr:S9 family peptidase [Natranaeroarchaeum aerophilus]MCL9814045.1 S9 family peptidase [Natranaeroarchaeum aerophilus]